MRETWEALPASLRWQEAMHTKPPARSGGDHRGVICTEIITCIYFKVKPDSSTIVPNGSLEKADCLKLESVAGFLIPFLGTA